MLDKVTEKIEAYVLPIVEPLQLELVDIEFVKEGQDWFLRVYIDGKNDRVTLDECAIVTEQLSDVLDEQDPITQNYFLEVSSPGAERPLKKEEDFEKAMGQFVNIKTYAPVHGAKEFEGYLIENTNEKVVLDIQVKTRKVKIEIEKEKIAKARLAIDF